MKRMNAVNNLTGNRYGRLEVIGIDDAKEGRKTYWICKCDCGNVKSIRSDALVGGKTVSCGCRKNEVTNANFEKGYARRTARERGYISGHTRLYEIWQGMRKRCNYQNDPRYERYGGRGITVCDEWNDFSKFHDWALSNGYEENLTIDRINNDGNYEPSNCRWATAEEQCNNRGTNISIKIGNATKTLTEWCDIFELDYKVVYARFQRNGFISIDDLFRG